VSKETVKLEQYVVRDEGICGGKPRVAGTRITVQQIALEYEQLNMTPDEICDAHPRLTLAAVHSAIAYYYGHQDEILQTIRDDEEFVKSFAERN